MSSTVTHLSICMLLGTARLDRSTKLRCKSMTIEYNTSILKITFTDHSQLTSNRNIKKCMWTFQQRFSRFRLNYKCLRKFIASRSYIARAMQVSNCLRWLCIFDQLYLFNICVNMHIYIFVRNTSFLENANNDFQSKFLYKSTKYLQRFISKFSSFY